MQDLSVTDCIQLINSNLEQTTPVISVIGELANYRVSKGRWLYFDLKDDTSIVRFFGSISNLSQPIVDGMLLKVICTPKLHPQYGFNLNVIALQPFGEGSIKRSIELLKLKLEQEGLFADNHKREIVYPPHKIALITSMQSAAYADFIKIIAERWARVEIEVCDVLVQGSEAAQQIIKALQYFNKNFDKYDVVVLIRGGGSPEDLSAFNDEHLTRAVYNSIIPTMVAIGHEIDVCLAELAADRRASTPSNAAELLVPDTKTVLSDLRQKKDNLRLWTTLNIKSMQENNLALKSDIQRLINLKFGSIKSYLNSRLQIIDAYNPEQILKRGYAIVKDKGRVITSTKGVQQGDKLEIKLYNGKLDTEVIKIK